MDVRGDEKSFLSREKFYKVVFKEEIRRSFFGDSSREKSFSSGVRKEKEREGGIKKKGLFVSEAVLDNYVKRLKYRDSEKIRFDKNKFGVDSLDAGKGVGDLLFKVKEKVFNNLKI